VIAIVGDQALALGRGVQRVLGSAMSL